MYSKLVKNQSKSSKTLKITKKAKNKLEKDRQAFQDSLMNDPMNAIQIKGVMVKKSNYNELESKIALSQQLISKYRKDMQDITGRRQPKKRIGIKGSLHNSSRSSMASNVSQSSTKRNKLSNYTEESSGRSSHIDEDNYNAHYVNTITSEIDEIKSLMRTDDETDKPLGHNSPTQRRSVEWETAHDAPLVSRNDNYRSPEQQIREINQLISSMRDDDDIRRLQMDKMTNNEIRQKAKNIKLEKTQKLIQNKQQKHNEAIEQMGSEQVILKQDLLSLQSEWGSQQQQIKQLQKQVKQQQNMIEHVASSLGQLCEQGRQVDGNLSECQDVIARLSRQVSRQAMRQKLYFKLVKQRIGESNRRISEVQNVVEQLADQESSSDAHSEYEQAFEKLQTQFQVVLKQLKLQEKSQGQQLVLHGREINELRMSLVQLRNSLTKTTEQGRCSAAGGSQQSDLEGAVSLLQQELGQFIEKYNQDMQLIGERLTQ